jgi:hypothetical protein
MQPINSQNPEKDDTPAWLRPSKTAIIVQMILMAATPMALGIVAFCIIHGWDVEFQRKLEMIRRGEVKPETLSIIKINREKGNPMGAIAFGKDKKIMVWRVKMPLEGAQIGDETTAYPFDEEYLIPRFDRGNFWGKWIFLAGGLLMAFLGCGGMLLHILWRSRRNEKSRAATESTALPKAFSLPSMSFDGVPDDSQLVCLLGDPDCGPIRLVEEAGLLIVRPWLFPVKLVTAWMVFIALVITGVMCFMPLIEHKKLEFSSVLFFWLPLLFLWFISLPGLLGLLAVVNRSFAKKGDYFKVDMARRTLELCRIGRTINASEIIAVTLLTRWYRLAHGGWSMTHATGILVRTQGNRVELYPVVRELGENVPSSRKSKWAERLASIFQTPIRRIELSRSESRALNDC